MAAVPPDTVTPTPASELTHVTGWAAMEAKGSLSPLTWDFEDVGAHEVRVAVEVCGLCHTDLHLIDGDFPTFYPQVCGHEVVGKVVSVGDAVSHVWVGDRVGVGWNRSFCLHCPACTHGNEPMCDKALPTCAEGYRGGFADFVQVDASAVFKIPDALKSKHAAPLLCAGVTVYKPLMEHAEPGSRVGVVGIGGLGHLACMFAAARGCHVTAFSRGTAKEDLCLNELGARAYVDSTDDQAMLQVQGTLDFLLVTLTAAADMAPYLKALTFGGTVVFVGGASNKLEIPVSVLLMKNITITGSLVGGRGVMHDMLEFAALHEIMPLVEEYPFEEINTAVERLRSNKMRFRAVLVHKQSSL